MTQIICVSYFYIFLELSICTEFIRAWYSYMFQTTIFFVQENIKSVKLLSFYFQVLLNCIYFIGIINNFNIIMAYLCRVFPNNLFIIENINWFFWLIMPHVELYKINNTNFITFQNTNYILVRSHNNFISLIADFQ